MLMTGMARDSKKLVALGLLLEFVLVLLVAVTGLDRGSPLLEIFFFLPFLIYLLATWRIGRMQQSASPRHTGVIILFFALLFHATLLFSPTPLSNDVYRYYWDGKASHYGFNPYAYSPDANALEPLRDANWDEVMNRDVHTMYPPLAQLVFASAYAISPSLLTFRLFSIAFSLLAIVILILILKELKLDVRYSLIYAWSPVAIIEFANSGHIDSLAVLLTCLSFLALLRKRMSLSATALALAVLGKIFPLLFAGLFFPRWGKKGTAIFVAVIAAFYLPFSGAGQELIQGSFYFADRGLFNGSLFPLLASALEHFLWRPEALQLAKLLVLVVFGGLFAFLFVRSLWQKENDLILLKYCFWLTGVFLLISPTMHPWYLTWVLPFVCFFPSASWILLSGTVVLARTVYIGFEATGQWEEIAWVRITEYLPFYLLLAWEPIRRIVTWINEDATPAGSAASPG